MKAIMQTRLKHPDGNCFEACVASILGCDLDEIPRKLIEKGSWCNPIVKYLHSKKLELVPFVLDKSKPYIKMSYFFDKSDGVTSGHAYVCLEDGWIHDPHPLKMVENDFFGKKEIGFSYMQIIPMKILKGVKI